MRTIGVIISKGPNAKEGPRIQDQKAHDQLWKHLYHAIGKEVPWETSDVNIEESSAPCSVATK